MQRKLYKNKEKFEKFKSRNRRLVSGWKKSVGRNNQGRITSRHRGSGNKQLYRKVDFIRKRAEKAKVIRIEKDPYRSARIALVEYSDGSQAYYLAPQDIKPNQVLETGEKVAIKPGNRMKLANIDPGTEIYNVELKAGQGGKLARSAGNSISLKALEGNNALIALPSGEIRLTSANCYASVGVLSNPQKKYEKLRKAGQSRHLGRRPKVRGVAMHPGAHPHGGGEGRSSIGMKYPKSPTGKHSKGKKTRKKKKYSNKLIISRGKKR